MSSQERAVQRFSDQLMDGLLGLEESDDETRRTRFREVAAQALNKLTKEEVIEILGFLMTDHEVFFDVFEKSVARSKNAASKGPG